MASVIMLIMLTFSKSDPWTLLHFKLLWYEASTEN